MPLRIRRTKIVATIGPACERKEQIAQLAKAGTDVFRLNFSHGDYDRHLRTIQEIHEVEEELGHPITILQDLQGPKIRVAALEGKSMDLVRGQMVRFVNRDPGANEIKLDYPYLAEEAKAGMQVLLCDGLIELRITRIVDGDVECEVLEGGVLSPRKGVNLPQLSVRLPSLTPKDLKDLAFGVKNGVDVVSLSFVRSPQDIVELKQRLIEAGRLVPVIAKIEKPQAVECLEEIIAEADGVMVARGDLGVEMGPEKVPMVQKRIIELSNRAGKPVITATQMLESMIKEARPTRAEVSDVANAIMDGTDAVMLSGETAMGVNPARAVEMMARIALDVEEQASFRAYPPAGRTEAHALAKAIAQMHTILECPLVVVRTRTGLSARLIAAERLDCPVMAFTDEKYVFHTLNLLWGIRPTYLADSLDLWQFVRFADIAPAKSRVIVADCDDRFDAPQATSLSIRVAD